MNDIIILYRINKQEVQINGQRAICVLILQREMPFRCFFLADQFYNNNNNKYKLIVDEHIFPLSFVFKHTKLKKKKYKMLLISRIVNIYPYYYQCMK